MRLIDAKRFEDRYFIGKDEIENAATIKAIPIEWIKNIINTNLYLWEQTKERMFIDQGVVKVVNYSMTAQILSELIDRWEQENEED